MARKSSPPPPPPSKNLGKQDLESGIRKLERRIEELKAFDVSSVDERWDARAQSLEDKIHATMAEIFGEGSPEYSRHSISGLDTLPMSIMGEQYSVSEIQEGYQKGIRDAVIKLESVRDLLQERLTDLGEMPPAKKEEAHRAVGTRVFIVHGRDEAAKEAAARFVTRLNLEPIILHEQPNGGRTIIEKLEEHLDVDFAIVLLTPDDVGAVSTEPANLKSRARQNVVLELGLFLGALGRKKVCALHKGALELPSDFAGVVYVPMDEAGGWRLLLAREMKQAGMTIDLNLAM